MKYREEADYSPVYIVSEEDYADFKKDAVFLGSTIDEYLKMKGLFEISQLASVI